MIILVDMDGVLDETHNQLHKRFKETYPHLPVLSKEKITQYSIEDNYPSVYKGLFDKVWMQKGLFASFEPIDGAIEGINKLATLPKTEVFICTTPFFSSDYCAKEKISWVQKYLGDKWADKMILTKDKTLVYGDYLIDDKPAIKGVAQPAWQQLLYTQPWNESNTTLERVNNWKEILDKFI